MPFLIVEALVSVQIFTCVSLKEGAAFCLLHASPWPRGLATT